MTRRACFVALILVWTAPAVSQDDPSRAWQRRLAVEIPLAVPVVEMSAVNPFATTVDEPPRRIEATPPEKLDVAGTAVVAAYVDSAGQCRGAVPLEMPFPGLTSVAIQEVTSARWEPATAGAATVPAWAVIEIDFEGRVKEGQLRSETLVMPDPAAPPQPTVSAVLDPPGSLEGAAYTPVAEVTGMPSPRRIRARIPSRDLETPVRALVHITAEGRADRFVPLDLEQGLARWLSAYLASWRLEPGRRHGEPVDAWVIYQARAVLEMGSLSSEDVRVVRGRQYRPEVDRAAP